MASSRDDGGQLLLLAGVLLVISYVLFSSQASLIATLGQQSGREASNPVVIDYVAVREAIQVTLTREHTVGATVTCTAGTEAAMKVRAEAILQNIALVESRRGLKFAATLNGPPTVGADEFVGDFLYDLTLSLTNGETSINERAEFRVDC
ncbi:MAG: hypothetical protein HYT80_00875 [Euryarchaeota archaeon]|nr:hypothetical protein [Euryarchaeota archaeon]